MGVVRDEKSLNCLLLGQWMTFRWLAQVLVLAADPARNELLDTWPGR